MPNDFKFGAEKPSTVAPPLVADPDAVAAMLFSTLVMYGPTGSRKTSQLGEFAKYIYEKTGKKTRLISMDGGGWGPIQDLINVGIIDAWRIVEEEYPKVAIVKASRGMWPDKIVNGLRQGRATEPANKENLRASLKDVGAYAVEGWTSIANALMRDAVTKGQKINEDVVSKFTETETDFGAGETFGAPSRGHYGFAQNLILDIIRNFSALPVERIAYTALEGKGEDRLTKALTYGPQVAGNAITASIPQYVGDCLHLEDFQKEAGVDPENPKQKLVSMEVRAWFTSHPDITNGVIWPAKSRIVPAKVEEFRAKIGKDGYFILNKDNNLYTYLKAQDEVLASSSAELLDWKKRIDAERAASK